MALPKITPMLVEYINFRGETALRRIIPNGPPVFSSNEWHPRPQWLLPVIDADRSVHRSFAMDSIFPVHPTGLMRAAVINDLERALGDMIEAAEKAIPSLEAADNLSRADKLRAAAKLARSRLLALGQEPLTAARDQTVSKGNADG